MRITSSTARGVEATTCRISPRSARCTTCKACTWAGSVSGALRPTSSTGRSSSADEEIRDRATPAAREPRRLNIRRRAGWRNARDRSILRPFPGGARMRILLLALFAFGGGARAITVDELLAKNLAARGGAENLQKLKTLRLTGRAFFSGAGRRGARVGSARAQGQKRPGRSRSEGARQGLT